MRIIAWLFALLLIIALAVGAFLVKTRYDGLTARLAQCHAERDEQKAKLAETSAERDRERTAREGSDRLAAESQASLSATRGELEELRKLRADAEQRLTAFNAITARLQKMTDMGKLKVLIRDGRMIVKLPAEVLFPSGSAELSPDGQAALKEVASVLKEYEDRRFMVAGHTDNVPLAEAKYRNNWELSTARALTVTEFVIAAGMRPNNLVAAGYGEFDPVSPNNTPSGRQENRRIEIVLLPSVDELPRLIDQQEGAAPAGASIPAAASAAPAAPR
ncbi:uncharacterized protein SOCEGT47_029870 [Sorangium cellulosum]|jgi:chemotaxis protein MotB|uniref:OmpA-like domain-containing protein n=1 Tax=Sorangium cellulosum TaxID=56 RepID=A0A4P2PZW8_SORCE|nr:OmpA family protein [Sorangium cellulosum]AUX22484.1 uncharacterized protein SOCEGT47_029870 [Sorangium cellulosum]